MQQQFFIFYVPHLLLHGHWHVFPDNALVLLTQLNQAPERLLKTTHTAQLAWLAYCQEQLTQKQNAMRQQIQAWGKTAVALHRLSDEEVLYSKALMQLLVTLDTIPELVSKHWKNAFSDNAKQALSTLHQAVVHLYDTHEATGIARQRLFDDVVPAFNVLHAEEASARTGLYDRLRLWHDNLVQAALPPLEGKLTRHAVDTTSVTLPTLPTIAPNNLSSSTQPSPPEKTVRCSAELIADARAFFKEGPPPMGYIVPPVSPATSPRGR